MTERPSADRWLAMTAAQLIEELERVGAELDAVTRERDAFEKRIDEQNRQISKLTAQRVVLENEIADANRREEGEA